jgi:hypothetical protein
VVYDSTESNEVDRIKIYINGEHDTNQTSVNSVALNEASTFGTSGQTMYLNAFGHSSGNDQGKSYQADVCFIDGSVTLPSGYSDWGSVFVEDTGFGSVKPRDTSSILSSSDFGTNGFHLKFEDSSDIGADSANSNDFTATNLASHDVMPDVPYSKNYATINPLIPYGTATNSHTVTLSEGNLRVDAGSGSGWGSQDATIAVSSGKFYFEAYVQSSSNSSGGMVGVHPVDGWVYAGSSTPYLGYTNTSVAYLSTGGLFTNNSTTSTGYNSYTTGDVIGCAFDVDSRKVWFSKNGTWQNSGDPANDSNPAVTLSGSGPLIAAVRAYLKNWVVNFGQDPTFANNKPSGQDTSQSEFYYAPPTGFKSLNTSNLDDPTIKPHEHFAAATYTGAGGSEEIDLGFTPNLTWIKRRVDSGYYHGLYDSARGLSAGALASNTTDSEDSTQRVASFDSDTGSEGFTLSSTHYSYTNTSGKTFISWNWKESASAGFDIVTYEGNSDSSGDTQSISHSLGVAPEMIIVKARDGRAANDYYARDYWYVWHKDLTSGSSLYLNDSSAEVDYSSGYTSAPISSVGSSTFTVCNAEEYNNYYYDFLNWGDPYGYYTGDNERYVAYLFSSVEGHSKFGSYTGTGSATSPPFIYTGFRVGCLITKNIDNGSVHWNLHDAARNPHNVVDERVFPNLSNASDSNYDKFDFYSNGFRPVTGDSGNNGNGNTIIYAAFAESPFKYANAR